MAKVYRDPFHPDTIVLAKNLDDCLIKGDWKEQQRLVDEIEDKIDNYDDISQANIYCCLGTTYSSIGEKEPSIQNIERQFFCFQKSIYLLEENETNFADGIPYILGLKLPLYTNYANLLSHCGRKIPAIQFYLKTLFIDEGFAMGLGNLGMVYHHYAILTWNPASQNYLHHCAYVYLSRALSNPKNAHSEALARFEKVLQGYNPEYVTFLTEKMTMENYTYTGEEEAYRKWAMRKRLFLNPLNDLPFYEFYIATDDLHLPDMLQKIDEKPVLHGLYNQLKQEYVFSRYLFYESLQYPSETHYADKETCLFQFADYPSSAIISLSPFRFP